MSTGFSSGFFRLPPSFRKSLMLLTMRSIRSLSFFASSSHFPIIILIPTSGVVRSCAVAARKSSRDFTNFQKYRTPKTVIAINSNATKAPAG